MKAINNEIICENIRDNKKAWDLIGRGIVDLQHETVRWFEESKTETSESAESADVSKI